jgi:hypothetical protein
MLSRPHYLFGFHYTTTNIIIIAISEPPDPVI